MIYEDQNFARQQPELEPGSVLVGCNCAQEQPHTPFGHGVPGLVFIRCNLTNCDLPLDAVLDPVGTPLQVRYTYGEDGEVSTEAVA
jgi:hypothetical protein